MFFIITYLSIAIQVTFIHIFEFILFKFIWLNRISSWRLCVNRNVILWVIINLWVFLIFNQHTFRSYIWNYTLNKFLFHWIFWTWKSSITIMYDFYLFIIFKTLFFFILYFHILMLWFIFLLYDYKVWWFTTELILRLYLAAAWTNFI